MGQAAEKSRSIPSLDGLRALSVFAVILGHTHSTLLDSIPFSSSFRNGGQGVAVFFVISGFLITHLLLKELARENTIDLRRFYLRRTFRIFPPFYVFILVIAVLAHFHRVVASVANMLAAATYTWNYAWTKPDSWVLGHCWSLSIEEQFYLLWPFLMARFSRRTNIIIASTVVLLSPISRIVTYFVWPFSRTHIDMMLHTHLDTIMMGCLLSLVLDQKIWVKITRSALSPAVPIAAIFFLLAVDTPAEHRWKGMYQMTIGISLENIAIAALLLFVVFRHESWLGKFLNLRVMRHLGMISYSLYLWQQLFTGIYTRFFPLNILAIIGCAEISYLLVERPSFVARDFVQKLRNSNAG